jgi:pimeloyl-ACP methyl ester carboxylesterase
MTWKVELCITWLVLLLSSRGLGLAEDLASGAKPEPAERSILNLDSPTFGGMQFWSDEMVFHDWRIQRHTVSGHCRLLDEKNVRRAWGSFEDCATEFEQIKQQKQMAPLKPRVVLLMHGLVRSRESMDGLCEYLRGVGDYSVLNISYASSRGTVADHAKTLARVIRHLDGVSEVNFVAHSLGNLVIRHYFHDLSREASEHRPAVRFGRVVMLAPPNNGAEMARRFQDNTLFRAVWGASGKELATKWSELEGCLAVPQGEFGIIAGGKGNDEGLNPLIAGDDDFVVGVEETRLVGAADFLVLPALHGTIMADERVQECTLRFLRCGYFESPEARRPITAANGQHD